MKNLLLFCLATISVNGLAQTTIYDTFTSNPVGWSYDPTSALFDSQNQDSRYTFGNAWLATVH